MACHGRLSLPGPGPDCFRELAFAGTGHHDNYHDPGHDDNDVHHHDVHVHDHHDTAPLQVDDHHLDYGAVRRAVGEVEITASRGRPGRALCDSAPG